jgi:glycosyltransferase involved in cell wall biosynthesis
LQQDLEELQIEFTFIGRPCFEVKPPTKHIPPVSKEELAKLLPSFDFYLTASRMEAGANHVLEAMACGLPIVSSNAGGVKSILGKHNCVVELSNNHQLNDCLSKFSVNLKLRRDVSEKNRMQSKKYAWKNVAKNIDQYILN